MNVRYIGLNDVKLDKATPDSIKLSWLKWN
jgi:hypothetical protein